MPSAARIIKTQSGFTLIELLAVIVVIGIATAVVTISVGDGSKPIQIKSAARLLYDEINIASEEAVSGNVQVGLHFDIDTQTDETRYTYQWLRYNPEAKSWMQLGVEGLEQKTLPVFIDLELEVEGQKVVIGSSNDKLQKMFDVKEDDSDNDKKEKIPKVFPDLYFLSSGEMQNFTITLADDETKESRYRIIGDMLGQLSFKRPDEDEK